MVLSWILVTSGHPRHPLACCCITPVSASIVPWHSPYASLSSQGHLLSTPVLLDQGPTLLQYDLTLANHICNDPILRSYSEMLGLQPQYIFLCGDTVQLITGRDSTESGGA